jgi:hypothetical protein
MVEEALAHSVKNMWHAHRACDAQDAHRGLLIAVSPCCSIDPREQALQKLVI